KLERHLNMGWKTIKKYLDAPAQAAAPRQRQSKLDPFKALIADCLEKDPRVTAALILQRIKDLGYSGGHAILQEYVHKVRPDPASKRAFVRMEPFAGERFEVDWRSEEHTSELQSQSNLVCRLLLEKKKNKNTVHITLKPNSAQSRRNCLRPQRARPMRSPKTLFSFFSPLLRASHAYRSAFDALPLV